MLSSVPSFALLCFVSEADEDETVCNWLGWPQSVNANHSLCDSRDSKQYWSHTSGSRNNL